MINADGSLAANCGNACRVIAASVAQRQSWSAVTVHTFARTVPCRVAGGQPHPLVEVDMGVTTDGTANP